MLQLQRFFVTGAAGFIGSSVVDRLLAGGHAVTGYDNFSTGQRRFLDDAGRNERFSLIEGDLLDEGRLGQSLRPGFDFVFHFAANADVRFGADHPRRDLEQNTVATFNVLEAMRSAGVKRIGFSSTGSIYGEPAVFPTPESCPFPVQTSFYGASKLACEGLIQAYASSFGFQGCIFRFVSILGPRYTHGHVFDFCRQLAEHPDRIDVLGDGKQRKSYLHISDCIDAMLAVVASATDPVAIYNLGTDAYCQVDDSIGWICQRLGLTPRRIYAGGERGWIGDSPLIFLDAGKVRSLGWAPRYGIRQGVEATVDFLRDNPWVFERGAH